jgi:hypothetical protein
MERGLYSIRKIEKDDDVAYFKVLPPNEKCGKDTRSLGPYQNGLSAQVLPQGLIYSMFLKKSRDISEALLCYVNRGGMYKSRCSGS